MAGREEGVIGGREVFSSAEDEGSGRTTRMETVAWRFWTLVTRARTVESTVGRVLNFSFCFLDAADGPAPVAALPFIGALSSPPLRAFLRYVLDTVRVGRDFDFDCSGTLSMKTGPAMEAQMDEFCTCVPGPAVYAVEAPSCWPGIAVPGTVVVVATVMAAGVADPAMISQRECA